MINFDDTKAVFAHKSNFELRKSYYLFSILQHSLLVKIGSLLLKISFFLRLPIKKLIKTTIFNQFCGGENIQDCSNRINELYEFGIGTILDYSVEGSSTEKDFEYSISKCLNILADSKSKNLSRFIVFKPSAVGRFSLYKKVSSKGKLSIEEKMEWEKIENRFNMICLEASKKNFKKKKECKNLQLVF